MRKALEEYKLSKREEYLLDLITKITPGPPPGPGPGNGDKTIPREFIDKLNKKCEKAIYACVAKAQGRVKE